MGEEMSQIGERLSQVCAITQYNDGARTHGQPRGPGILLREKDINSLRWDEFPGSPTQEHSLQVCAIVQSTRLSVDQVTKRNGLRDFVQPGSHHIS
jgi:hypothetical protein